MTPRNLSLSNAEDAYTAQDIGRADQECHEATPQAVADWIKASAGLGTLKGISYRQQSTNAAMDAFFYPGMWLARAAQCYFDKRADIAQGDRDIIEPWLADQAEQMRDMLQVQLGSFFPLRLLDDYSETRLNINESRGKLTHAGGHEIFVSSVLHNNRRAAIVMAMIVIGLPLGLTEVIDECKRFVREWVMFSVYQDGEQGEFERADDYGNPVQGLLYGAINISVALEVAARLADTGDWSLVDFATVDGLNGTLSTKPKTIFTAFEYMLDVIDGSRVVRTGAGNLVDWYGQPVDFAHWAYSLVPAVKLKRANRLRLLADKPKSGKAEDHYWSPWSGVCGVYAADTRSFSQPIPRKVMATAQDQLEAQIEFMRTQIQVLKWPTGLDIAKLVLARVNDKASGTGKTSEKVLQDSFDEVVWIVRKSVEFMGRDGWWLESRPEVSATVVDARNR